MAISGVNEDRILTGGIFNDYVKKGHFSETTRCLKPTDVGGISWTETKNGETIQYDVLINLEKYQNGDKLVRCGDVTVTERVVDKSVSYSIYFPQVQVGTGVVDIKNSNWQQQGGGMYNCYANVTFNAYGDGGKVYVNELTVLMEGSVEAGSGVISNITAHIDGIYFTALESQACTSFELIEHDYIIGISQGKRYNLSELKKVNNITWPLVTLELSNE